jgi:transcriptional regulator with XRE-family HTH domain
VNSPTQSPNAPAKSRKCPPPISAESLAPPAHTAPPESLTLRIADRVRPLRVAAKLSLDALAQQSGVSRSMISAIERGETNPTAVVLDRLASALGVTLTGMLEQPQRAGSPLLRKSEQTAWRDSSSGYERRSLSAGLPDSRMRLIEVNFPAHARVAYESAGMASPIEQQIWMLSGTMEITVADARYRLDAGDSLTMRVDGPNVFFNPGHKAARYLVAQA